MTANCPLESNMTSDDAIDNRAKKVEGRAKKRRFVQGTRAYTHAITNSIAKRAAQKEGKNKGDGGEERSG
jgi:hypothetical protein